MDKHMREVMTIKKIVFTVFMLTSLSVTMLSPSSLQMATVTDHESITIGRDGIEPETASAKFNVSNNYYRLKENITFISNGIVIECPNIVLDLSDFTISTKSTHGQGPVGITCTDAVSNVTIKNGTVDFFDTGIKIKQDSANISVTDIILERNAGAIQIYRSCNVTVISNEIKKSTLFGLHVDESHYINLTGNVIEDQTKAAVHIKDSEFVEVHGNNITSRIYTGYNVYAFQVDYSNYTNVTCNRIISERGGIKEGVIFDESLSVYFASNSLIDWPKSGIEIANLRWSSGNCSIIDNDILNCPNAILLRGDLCKNVNVSDNIILDSKGYGIQIREGACNSTVSCNKITNASGTGIHLKDTSGNDVFNNTLISNAGVAIKLEETKVTNVSENTALDNSIGIDCTKSHSNRLTGNNATSNRLAGISLSYCTNNSVLSNIVNESQKGICLNQSSDNTICNNTVTNNEQGITTNNSDNVTVSGNYVVLSTNGGISIQDSINNTVSGNIVTLCTSAGITCSRIRTSCICENNITHQRNGKGILALQGLNCSILSNTVSYNMEGIWIGNSTQCDVKGNSVSNNMEGIWIGNSTQCDVKGNSVSNNTEGGICLSFGASNNTIFNNTIALNAGPGGVWLGSSATGNNIIWNSFSWNEVGLCIKSGENVIYHNNFVNNTICQAKCTNLTCRWNNGREGNYWNEYTSTDKDRDGIGADPYIIDKDVNDSKPLMGAMLIFKAEYTYETPFGSQTAVTRTYDVTLMSNATVVSGSVSFILDAYPIRFTITQSVGATAFCKITFPAALMTSDFTIKADNEKVEDVDKILDEETMCYTLFVRARGLRFSNKGNLSVEIGGNTSGLFLLEDLDRDGRVGILDISIVAWAFGATPGHDNWSETADLNRDDNVTILDISWVAWQFGTTYVDADD